jgi:hypothetical protein
MTPEERRLLERSLKLGEENHIILKRIDRRARWAVIWGFVKLAVIAIPLVAGYLYLEPYFLKAAENYNSVQELIGHVDLPF